MLVGNVLPTELEGTADAPSCEPQQTSKVGFGRRRGESKVHTPIIRESRGFLNLCAGTRYKENICMCMYV